MKPTSITFFIIPASLLMAGLTSAAPITFDVPPYSLGVIGALNGSTSNASFTGQQGWSLSTSDGTGTIATTTTSNEYIGGHALSANATASRTYIGGKLGVVEITGTNSITFDARYLSGGAITAGFLGNDGDNLFDQSVAADTGMQFGGHGPSGSTVYYRDAGFGTNQTIPGVTGNLTAGDWFRHIITIGEVSGGNRSITMSVRDLTTGTDLDLNGASGGNSITFSVGNSTFGVAPEAAVGGFIRISNPGGTTAAIDNLQFTAVPEPGTLALLGVGILAIGFGVARKRWRIGLA